MDGIGDGTQSNPPAGDGTQSTNTPPSPVNPSTSDELKQEPKKQNNILETDQKPHGPRYIAAFVLVATVAQLPVLVALFTIAVYNSHSSFPVAKSPPSPQGIVEFLNWLGILAILDWLGGYRVIFLGIIFTLPVLLLLALVCMSFATAAGRNPLNYEHLQRSLKVLQAREAVLELIHGNKPPNSSSDTEKNESTAIALADIRANLGGIEKLLNTNGLQWVTDSGYAAVWGRIHKAEEAMLSVLPTRIVLAEAEYDKLRLKESDIIEKVQELPDLLDTAIETLKTKDQAGKDQAGKDQDCKEAARATVVQVRCALDKYTDERRNGLVRSRNLLLRTSLLVGAFTYVLLALAIISNVPSPTIINATVFYLLGAAIGLFYRLYTEWNRTDPAVDDFGLTAARILITPVLCGFAALVGVFLALMLSITLVGDHPNIANIGDIYDLTKFPQNLVFAAVFGFAPNVVINILQQKAEDIKSQLKSTNVAETSANGSAGSKSASGGSKAKKA